MAGIIEMVSRNLFALADDFSSDVHKFDRRTFLVRPMNCGAQLERSSEQRDTESLLKGVGRLFYGISSGCWGNRFCGSAKIG